jgi:hypothetical protein
MKILIESLGVSSFWGVSGLSANNIWGIENCITIVKYIKFLKYFKFINIPHKCPEKIGF